MSTTKTYSKEYLLSVRHLGAALLGSSLAEGKEISRQAKELAKQTGNGVFGPALLSTEPLKKKSKPKAVAPVAMGATMPGDDSYVAVPARPDPPKYEGPELKQDARGRYRRPDGTPANKEQIRAWLFAHPELEPVA